MNQIDFIPRLSIFRDLFGEEVTLTKINKKIVN